MKNKLMVLVIGLAAFQIASFGQGTKTAPPPPPSPRPEAPPDPSQSFMSVDLNRSINAGHQGDFLIGKVKLERGPLPWEPIPVSVTCDGEVRYKTNADSSGNFMISLMKPPGWTQTKADKKPFAFQFVGCAVEASLPGFDSSLLTVTKRNVRDNSNMGSIILRRKVGPGHDGPSTTSDAAPSDAVQLFEKAWNESLANKSDNAAEDLRKAVAIYPQFAEAWYQLGKIQEESKSAEAWSSFSKAVAADTLFPLPYEHMALLAAQSEKWQQLVDVTTQELGLNPLGTANIWYFNALGNYHLRTFDVAEVGAKKSLAMDPSHMQPNTEQLLAVILVEKQDFAGALQHLRNCLTYLPPGPDLNLVKEQIADIKPFVAAPN
jgi:tetratricopeptide (TPR) repeat protein